jgi:hypothetical protein
LTRRIGAERVAAEPEAVADIVTACARLPLALAIAAARAALRPGFPLTALAADLGALDAAVRAVFSWSLRAVTPGAVRLFGLLGLHPGPDISVPAAASLAGEPPDRLRPLLAELTSAHLLTEYLPGRYTFHDLLRRYAAEQASTADGARAVHRMYDHYLHSAVAAVRELAPQGKHISPAPARPGVTPESSDDHRGALAWFNTAHR